jgi:hypothetical protein
VAVIGALPVAVFADSIPWLIAVPIVLGVILIVAKELNKESDSTARTPLPASNSIYGEFLEEQFTPSGTRMPEKSIIHVRPKSSFLGMKRGLVIEGTSYGDRTELRKIEALQISISQTSPLVVKYSYSVTENEGQLFGRGSIRFMEKSNGRYMAASGEFVLPQRQGKPVREDNARILFQWRRISTENIRALIGKESLTTPEDDRFFLERCA